ncbi:MAG: amidohydrolase [Magnetovibrio sp.]|nr:amidohydrolase [Magnetovibrio sp.]
MTSAFKLACVQTTSGPDIDANIRHVSDIVRSAGDAGANFIGLPEVVNIMEMDRKTLANKITNESADQMLIQMRGLAEELGVWILIGSIVVQHETSIDQRGRPKFANRSILVDDKGAVRARYDKIHMFDVSLGSGESYQESRAYEPGRHSTLCETPWGLFGLTVCYDVRFPYLFRDLAKSGAQLLSVPSAFTRQTGHAHWHILLQARAIENGCFIIAPAQCGDHGSGRTTFGHSLIVSPWGEILADAGEEPGFIVADIDMNLVKTARSKVPSINNDRVYTRL